MDITREGIWKNPVLLKILAQQPVDTEEGKHTTFRDDMWLLRNDLVQFWWGTSDSKSEEGCVLNCVVR